MDGPVELEFFDDAAAFLAVAQAHLAADPVIGSVVATVTQRLRDDGTAGGDRAPTMPPPWWVVVRDTAGEVAGVGMRTAPFVPHPLFLLPMPAGSGAAIARAMRDRGEAVTGGVYGVNGAIDAATECAQELARLTGGASRVLAHLRLFESTDRRALQAHRDGGPPGTLRRATSADLDLVLRWFDEFDAAAEAQAGRPPSGVHGGPGPDQVVRWVERGGVWLWLDEHGTPVHLTAATLPAFGVSRVGPVYTPAAYRGRGHATRVVAHVTQQLLDQGVRVCLYTDQANPTSNAIYQRIGYTPVVDTANLRVQPV